MKGLATYRFKDNPLEQRFAEAWEHNNFLAYTLVYLLSESGRREDTTMTARDEVVAATVIQWLGSPVGQSFLRDVLGEEVIK